MKSETGEEIWRFGYATDYEDMYGYNNGPRACPVVDGDRVYVFGAEGMLHCVSALDGELIWKVNTGKKFDVVKNFFGVASAPIVERNLLFVQIGADRRQVVPKTCTRLRDNSRVTEAASLRLTNLQGK